MKLLYLSNHTATMAQLSCETVIDRYMQEAKLELTTEDFKFSLT